MQDITRRVTDIINGIIKAEGGYVNDPDDLGGETNFGITAKAARAWGYTGDMKDLDRKTAFQIYLDDYYTGPRFDRVAKYAPYLAAELTDTGVNMGQAWAVKFLQRALNAFNDKGRLYPDVSCDGFIGSKTLSALGAFIEHRGAEGEGVLVASCDHLQGARYIELAEQREANERYVYGWIANRTEV